MKLGPITALKITPLFDTSSITTSKLKKDDGRPHFKPMLDRGTSFGGDDHAMVTLKKLGLPDEAFKIDPSGEDKTVTIKSKSKQGLVITENKGCVLLGGGKKTTSLGRDESYALGCDLATLTVNRKEDGPLQFEILVQRQKA